MAIRDGLTISIGRGKTIRRMYFGAFLALAGAAVVTWLTVHPLVCVFAARSWTPTVCTIMSSKLEGNADGSGTHRVLIAYDYTFHDEVYHGNRYAFAPAIPAAGHKSKQAIVAANPPGHRTTCFVNPASPEQSVLVRATTVDFLWGLTSLPFVLVGMAFIVADLRESARKSSLSGAGNCSSDNRNTAAP
jgi:hypothetical protein